MNRVNEVIRKPELRQIDFNNNAYYEHNFMSELCRQKINRMICKNNLNIKIKT